MKKMAILNAAQTLKREQGASVLSAENTTQAGGCGRRCALWAEQIFRKYGVPGDYGLEPADLVFLNSVLTAFPVRIREKSGFSLICQLFFANYNQDIRIFRYRLPDWVGEKMPIRSLTGSAGIAAGFDGGRLWAREGVAEQLRGLGSWQEWFWGWKSEEGQFRELGSWERQHEKAVEVRRSSPWGRGLVGISGKSGENETPAVRSGLAVFRGIDQTALGAGMTGAVARGTGAQAERGRPDRGYTGIPTQEYQWELLRLTAAGFKAAFRTVPAGRKSILLVCGAQRRQLNRTVKGLPARIVTAETGLAQSQRMEAGWPPAGLVEAELAEAVPTETEAAGIELTEMGAAKEGSAGNRPVEAVTAELRTAAFFEETKAPGSLADSIRVGPRIGTGLEFLQAIPCTGDQDRLECFRQKKAGRLAGVEMHGKPAGPPLPGITVWTKRMASYEEFGCSGPAAVAAEPNLARRAVKDGTAAFFAPSVKLVLSHGAVRLMLYGPSARGFWTGFMARSAVDLQRPGSPVWEQRPGRPADLTRLTLTSGKGWPAVVAWALRSGLSANSEPSGPATGLPSGLSAGTGSFGQSENEVSRVTFADTKLSGPAMWTGRGGQIADNLPGSLFADKVFGRILVWPDGSGRSAGIMPFRIFVGKVYGNTSVWPEVPGPPAGIIQFKPIGYIVSRRIRIWPDGSGWSADIMPGNSFVAILY